MRRGYLTSSNQYYEARSKIHDSDVEVPLRNSLTNPEHESFGNSGLPLGSGHQSQPMNSPHGLPTPFTPQYSHPVQPQVQVQHSSSQAEKEVKEGIFSNITWRDMVTVITTVIGLSAVWFQTTERITLIDHKIENLSSKVSGLYASVSELKGSDKEIVNKLEGEIKALSLQLNEMSFLFLRLAPKEGVPGTGTGAGAFVPRPQPNSGNNKPPIYTPKSDYDYFPGMPSGKE